MVLFLLSILVYNSIGFIINFQFVLTEWRREMSHFLSTGVSEKKIIQFSFEKNSFDLSTKEFSDNNKRYDVVKTEMRGEKIIVYCFSDDEETRLMENFNEQLFSDALVGFNFSKKINTNEKNKNNNFLKEFIFEKNFSIQNYFLTATAKRNIFNYTSFFFSDIFPDVIAAPPEA